MLELQQLRVCLVEPSNLQSHIIVQLLAELGITQVETVGDAASALKRVAEAPAPDVLISALYLPDATGTELVYQLRESETDATHLPFILVSSETKARYLDPIRQAGCMAILPKPFDVAQLRKALDNTIDFINAEDDDSGDNDIDLADLAVLVVDDSLTARRHIRTVLERLGFQRIVEATDGSAAIPLLEQTLFDLVITDYNMPEVDGLQLVDFIRQHSMQSSVPVMMVSSEHDNGRLAAVMDAGVSAICDKPFETRTIRGMLNKILRASV